jgi:hypothetical protein
MQLRLLERVNSATTHMSNFSRSLADLLARIFSCMFSCGCRYELYTGSKPYKSMLPPTCLNFSRSLADLLARVIFCGS